ncbi:MAG: family 43 glycosylhydrolase [Akkermansiaceae bacterium]|nr:family 43 glycosylhydrolase [Armatimonadota bacterium]
MYYWYGENKDGANVSAPSGQMDRLDVIGVSCYSSRDLITWKNEGIVLSSRPDDPAHDLHPSQVLERPKVVFCPATEKYVLWAHVDSPDYTKARVGVAISDSPTGPFEYLGSFRPNDEESRDMTVYVDPADGAGYLVYSSEGNATTHITRLAPDFLSVEAKFKRAFEREFREAPALFTWSGKYYMVTSGCTGWDPNPARWHVADAPMGEWVTGGDPCIGDAKGTTFDAQSTFVLPLLSEPDQFIFLADRWHRYNLRDSRYVWLLLDMSSGEPRIGWR